MLMSTQYKVIELVDQNKTVFSFFGDSKVVTHSTILFGKLFGSKPANIFLRAQRYFSCVKIVSEGFPFTSVKCLEFVLFQLFPINPLATFGSSCEASSSSQFNISAKMLANSLTLSCDRCADRSAREIIECCSSG